MTEEKDPALSQEGASDGAATVADPQATEDAAESPEKSGEGAGATQTDQEGKPEELQIVVEGHETEAQKDAAQPWVKELRKKYRESEARREAAERELQALKQPSQAADPGPKPTLESCDFDAAAFEKNLESWKEKCRQKEALDQRMAQQAAEQQRALQSRLDVYAKGKEKLSKHVPDFPEAEAAVNGALNKLQQAVLLGAVDDPALVVCALGQNPKLLEDLAKEPDLLRFGVRLAKLEDKVKTKKTQAPPPEKPVNGSGAKSGAVDSTLERLRAQADKTGDRTAVTDYLRKQREAQRGN